MTILGTSSGFLTPPAAHAQPRDSVVMIISGTDVRITMVLVPGGTFTIGSPEAEPGREPDEGPQQMVALPSFWIGTHEVTHNQFAIFRDRRLDNEETAVEGERFEVDAVSRPSPPYEDPSHGMGNGNHPATGMTQWAALKFAEWLSLKTGRLFRLPTEAEWEYVCRAGTTTTYPFGDDAAPLGDYAWFAANSGDRFHPVGQKLPSPWGTYDMLGNVAEWTMDQYDAAAYVTWSEGVAHSPGERPTSEHPRTVRGGAFDDEARALRCADRVRSTLRWKRRDPQLPKSRWWNTDSPHVGFRLASPNRSHTIEEIRAYWAEQLRP